MPPAHVNVSIPRNSSIRAKRLVFAFPCNDQIHFSAFGRAGAAFFISLPWREDGVESGMRIQLNVVDVDCAVGIHRIMVLPTDWPLNATWVHASTFCRCVSLSLCAHAHNPIGTTCDPDECGVHGEQRESRCLVIDKITVSPTGQQIYERRLQMTDRLELSEDEWKSRLSPFEFEVLRLRHTEPAHSGEYNKHYEEGTYVCAACKTPLYTSKTKFDSGCGWPAFFDAIPGAIKFMPPAEDKSIEIVCARCDGHMGHIFKGEGFKTPTDERHCVNSVSIIFHADEANTTK